MPLAFFSCFFATIACFTIYQHFAHYKALKTRTWPSTEGMVTHSEFQTSPLDENLVNQLMVTYRYRVQEKDYEGFRIAYGYNPSNNHHLNRALREHITTGATVAVQYNPKNPYESTLAVGSNNFLKMHLFGAYVFLIFIILFFVLFGLSSATDHEFFKNLILR